MSQYLCYISGQFIHWIYHLMWLKELLLHKGSVKMDEYYGMFGTLYYSNGKPGWTCRLFSWYRCEISPGCTNEPYPFMIFLLWELVKRSAFISTCSIAPTNNAPIGHFENNPIKHIKSAKFESSTTDPNGISTPQSRNLA